MHSVTFASSVALVTLLAGAAQAATVAEWDFNDYDGNAHRIRATTGGGEVVIGEDWSDTSLSNPKGSVLNVAGEKEAGTALGLSGQARNGQSFDVLVPVSSSKPLTLTTALRRSGTGFTGVTVSVSADGGASFTKVTTWKPTEKWTAQSATLPLKSGSKRMMVRLTLEGAASARGGIRIDNLKVSDSVVSAPAGSGL